jgi:hypothetical protein
MWPRLVVAYTGTRQSHPQALASYRRIRCGRYKLIEWESRGTPNLPALVVLPSRSARGNLHRGTMWCGCIALGACRLLVVWGHIMYQLLERVGIIHVGALRDRQETCTAGTSLFWGLSHRRTGFLQGTSRKKRCGADQRGIPTTLLHIF